MLKYAKAACNLSSHSLAIPIPSNIDICTRTCRITMFSHKPHITKTHLVAPQHKQRQINVCAAGICGASRLHSDSTDTTTNKQGSIASNPDTGCEYSRASSSSHFCTRAKNSHYGCFCAERLKEVKWDEIEVLNLGCGKIESHSAS